MERRKVAEYRIKHQKRPFDCPGRPPTPSLCVCVSVHMCQYSQSHQKLDDSIMRTTIPSVVLPHSHSLLCPQKRMSSFLRHSLTLFFAVNPSKTTKQPPTLSTQLKSDFLIKNRHVPGQRCNSGYCIVQTILSKIAVGNVCKLFCSGNIRSSVFS